MIIVTDRYVLMMAAVRVLSSMIEFSAAMLMLRLNRVDSALKINALLSLVGPAILLTCTALGVAGLAGRIPLWRILLIAAGVSLILAGVNQR